jgi:hypothetical protein
MYEVLKKNIEPNSVTFYVQVTLYSNSTPPSTPGLIVDCKDINLSLREKSESFKESIFIRHFNSNGQPLVRMKSLIKIPQHFSNENLASFPLSYNP